MDYKQHLLKPNKMTCFPRVMDYPLPGNFFKHKELNCLFDESLSSDDDENIKDMVLINRKASIIETKENADNIRLLSYKHSITLE